VDTLLRIIFLFNVKFNKCCQTYNKKFYPKNKNSENKDDLPGFKGNTTNLRIYLLTLKNINKYYKMSEIKNI